MKLTLIRHGVTEGNMKKLYYGSTDIPLLPCSEMKLRRMAEGGGYPAAAHYYTSGMLRTEQTFRALYGDKPHEVLRDMREIDFGDFEMKTYQELCNTEAYQRWITGDNEANVCPNGESGDQVTRRALRSLAPLIAREEDCVVITHGGVIGGLMQHWFLAVNGRYMFTPEPGTGFTIEFVNKYPVHVVSVPAGKAII
ncbi:MAG: histidine phosphatase family protein [Clostridia bacterium]|nr:histidine phosphatase family protein [Clostridia bacterium]